MNPFSDKEELDEASEKEEFNLFLAELVSLILPSSVLFFYCSCSVSRMSERPKSHNLVYPSELIKTFSGLRLNK